MQLVVLAAGKGVRLGDEAQNRPKSLVNIAGIPYLQLQMQQFARFQSLSKLIVGGYGAEALQDFLNDYQHPDWQMVINPDFHRGNLYSLVTVLPKLHDGFWIFNADHFYSAKTYDLIFGKTPETVSIYCDYDRSLTDDDMKVSIANGQFQKMSKSLAEYQCGYVGITFIPKSRLEKYRECVSQTATELGDAANVEAVVNRMACQEENINICDISGSWWTEIDTPEDLQKARAIITQEMELHGK